MKLEEPPVVETEADDLSHRLLLTSRERQDVVLCANSLFVACKTQVAGRRNSEKGGAGAGNWKKMTPLKGERYCRDSALAMIAELDNDGAGRKEEVEMQDGRGARVAFVVLLLALDMDPWS